MAALLPSMKSVSHRLLVNSAISRPFFRCHHFIKIKTFVLTTSKERPLLGIGCNNCIFRVIVCKWMGFCNWFLIWYELIQMTAIIAKQIGWFQKKSLQLEVSSHFWRYCRHIFGGISSVQKRKNDEIREREETFLRKGFHRRKVWLNWSKRQKSHFRWLIGKMGSSLLRVHSLSRHMSRWNRKNG